MDVKRSHFAKYSCFGGIFVTKDIFQCLNLLQRKLQPHSPGGAANHAVPRGTIYSVYIGYNMC